MATPMRRVCHPITRLNISHVQKLGSLLNNGKSFPSLVECKNFCSTILVPHKNRLSWKRLCTHRIVSAVYILPNVRHNSSSQESVSQVAAQVTTDYIPPPPDVPDPQVFVETLNILGEPTFQSLGLGGFWPSGLVQSGLEFLHVSCGLPWIGAIVAGTFVLRLCLFPLIVLSQKNMAVMHNHMPTIQKLQEKFSEARRSGNQLAAAKRGQELMEYMQRHKVNPLKNAAVPFAQLPIFLSVFIGIRQMANLPVESMMTGGFLWFPNLIVPDPFYGLPLMTASTMLLTIEMGSDGVKAGSMGHNVKWLMRAMPFMVFPFISNFPAAMCVYWATANVCSLCTVLVLKIPQVRTYFKIEKLVKHEDSGIPKKKFIEGFRESWENAKVQHQIEDRHKIDAKRFQKAATGPVPRTFAYDPTKVKTDKIKAET